MVFRLIGNECAAECCIGSAAADDISLVGIIAQILQDRDSGLRATVAAVAGNVNRLVGIQVFGNPCGKSILKSSICRSSKGTVKSAF